MAYTRVLSDIPEKMVAGESASWKYANSDFPASSGWSLVYSLINAAGKITITSTADGSDHLVEVASGKSANYAVGEYDWQAHVSNGTERYKVAEGVIEITPDFEAQSAYDTRSHAKKVLDALEASIEGRASKTQLSHTIAGVQIQHMTFDELLRMRNKYAAKYQGELVASGKARSRSTIKTRFPV